MGCSHSAYNHLKYLGQDPPLLIPETFAPDIISKKEESEFGSVFNSDATEFFYGVDVNGKSEIRYTYLNGEHWSDPEIILVHEEYGYNDSFLSPYEKRLYFISPRALDGVGGPKDHDIWYVEKRDNGWSDPVNAGNNINSDGNEYYMSFTNDGTMYFASNINAPEDRKHDYDIYSSKNIDGVFQEKISLGDSINTMHYEADVYIDPNEAYMIFCAIRPGGLGRGDLYISFRKPDDTWTRSRNLGQPINTEHHELCPFVSKDGKYLFYTSDQDIYWVDTEILELPEK
jgi:hypothetical protein